jgi:hypothetical protein
MYKRDLLSCFGTAADADISLADADAVLVLAPLASSSSSSTKNLQPTAIATLTISSYGLRISGLFIQLFSRSTSSATLPVSASPSYDPPDRDPPS